MSSINKTNSFPNEKTFEGGVASRVSIKEQLKRSVMSCMLWEDSFYEDGVSVTKRIESLIEQVSETDAREILLQAKFESKLRHLPLYMLTVFAKKGWLKKEDVFQVVTRADDMTELLALYWKEGKKPLDKQLVKGIQLAFHKFNEYELGKYNRDKDVKLKDVLKITRPKPLNTEESVLWKKLLTDDLATPDTWEVAISACKTSEEKKTAFNRLLSEGKLGDLAFIRNLRKMNEVGVDRTTLKEYFTTRNWKWILPYQFVTAARYNPFVESEIEGAMLKCLEGREKLNVKVKLLVDVSGSMSSPVSDKSEASRLDVASGLAILLREVCLDIEIYTFNDSAKLVPSRRGFALRDAIGTPRGGTEMWNSIKSVAKDSCDLMIVITDEQTMDSGNASVSNSKLLTIINVANYQNGVGYGKGSLHISGWSENTIDYLISYVKEYC